ncbi:LOW QUALITY PROTEIN: hypothetical protein Cgig2_023120 [Carnegiea gigantea]|uniref:Uncharacterized protein n=1 Tax=Carnegiea gigantea TaxID=171969 RepID=A0A9Q1JRG2_9CARY|nr:LOW QUALITY PROTEIN: hypothetical protein Cgig2_023120 [Carnegiea gigantea]
MQIQSQWRVGGFYGLQWNKDENEFPGEYRKGKTIDRIDCQSIIHEGETKLGIRKHDTDNLRAHRTFGISAWLSASPLATMFRIWNTELQKTPNEVEVHGLTRDEHFFNDHEFFDAYLKMEAVFPGEYRKGKTIDRIDCQSIIHEDGSTELQKTPNEVEVHGLTRDEHFFNDHEFFDAYLKMEAVKMQIQSQWRVGGFYGLQWNKDENDFPGEYRKGKTIDRIDCQSIIHEGETKLGIRKHDTDNLRAHRTFGISAWLSASPLATMFRIWKKLFEVVSASGQGFPIQQVKSHIVDGSTELQKTPNEVEVHGLTRDEHFFNDHEFFDAYLKMEAVT